MSKSYAVEIARAEERIKANTEKMVMIIEAYEANPEFVERVRRVAWGSMTPPPGWPKGTDQMTEVRKQTQGMWDRVAASRDGASAAPSGDGDKWLKQFRAAVAGGES